MNKSNKIIITIEILVVVGLSIGLAFSIIWANSEKTSWEPKGAIVAALLTLVYFARDLFIRLNNLEGLANQNISSSHIKQKTINPQSSPTTGQITTQINNYGYTQDQINELIKQDTSEFITFISLRQTVFILDKESKVSHCIKAKNLVPNQDNIRTLDDRGFTTDGKFNFISSSLGTLLKPKSEGGKLIVTTLLEEPMQKGKEYTQELTYEVFNCFPEKIETISLFAEREFTDSLIIDVIFPNDRPVISSKSYVYDGEKREIFEKPIILNDGFYLVLVVPRPKKGLNYILEWEW